MESSSKSSLMSGSAAIKRFSQPFSQDALCEVHVKRNCTAHYYHCNMKSTLLWCTSLFSFFPLHSSPPPPINLLFMRRLLQKFLPHHVCEHLTQHICSAPDGEHGVLESFNITLCRAVSLDFSSCSGPDVPFSGAETHRRRCRQVRTDAVPLCSEVARSKVTFYTASVGMFKRIFFYRAFQTRLLLFCEVKLKLMTDMTL